MKGRGARFVREMCRGGKEGSRGEGWHLQGSHARFCRSCRHREGVTVVKPIIWVDRQPFSLIQHRTLHTLSSHLYSTTHYPLLDGKQAGLLARLFNPVRLARAGCGAPTLPSFFCLLCILFPFWGLIILSERGEEVGETRGERANEWESGTALPSISYLSRYPIEHPLPAAVPDLAYYQPIYFSSLF